MKRFALVVGWVFDHLCTPFAERIGLWRIFHPIISWAIDHGRD